MRLWSDSYVQHALFAQHCLMFTYYFLASILREKDFPLLSKEGRIFAKYSSNLIMKIQNFAYEKKRFPSKEHPSANFTLYPSPNFLTFQCRCLKNLSTAFFFLSFSSLIYSELKLSTFSGDSRECKFLRSPSIICAMNSRVIKCAFDYGNSLMITLNVGIIASVWALSPCSIVIF